MAAGALFRAVRRGHLSTLAGLYAPQAAVLSGQQVMTTDHWLAVYARLQTATLLVTGVTREGAVLWVSWHAQTWRGGEVTGRDRVHLNRQGLVTYHDSQLLG